MSNLKLTPGSIVYKFDKAYEIQSQVDLKSVLVKDVTSGLRTVMPISHFTAEPRGVKKEERSGQKPESISDEHWQIALERLEIIKPLLRPTRTKKEVRERAREYGLHESTLYDWIGRYEATGLTSSLAPGYTLRGGKGKSRLDPNVQAIVERHINDIIENNKRTKFNTLLENINKDCRNAELKSPDKATVRRRLFAKGRKKVSKVLNGIDEPKPHKGTHEEPIVLHQIQVDETPLDCICLDEKYRLPIGRAYGTFATDIASRVVYGLCLTPEHPSFFTFGQCMYMGILPKDPYLRDIGVAGDWDVWGLPKGVSICTDNARWFRGKDLKRFGEQYRLSPAFRRKGEPDDGGHVERLIKTINEKLHEKIPGTTFSDPDQRGDYDSEGMAVMTIRELEAWITDFLVNEYHQKEHSALNGMSPMQRWELGIRGSDTVPGIGLQDIIQGEEAEMLRISLLPSIERTIQRGNVTIDHIPYYHEVLVAVEQTNVLNKNKKYLFKRDPRDISFLYFIDKERNTYYKIPYRNPGWPAISIWEFKKVKRYQKEHHISQRDPDKIFEVHERLQKRVEDAALKTIAARRAMDMKKRHAEQMKKEAAKQGKKTTDSRDDRLRDIFAKAKPVTNIRVSGQERGHKGGA